MRSSLSIGKLDALRASIAGSKSVAAKAAAQALFEAGGKKVLPESVQRALRGAVEREASRLLSAVGMAERALESNAARAAAVQGARAAGRQVLRGVAASAGAGALVDGGWALVQAVRGVRSGQMTHRDAARHVAREAWTGAAATAAGTASAAMLIAVTGGIATPAVFVVAAVASIGAKKGLDAWLARAGQYPRFGASQRSTAATVLPFRRA
jgi:hypothetical protein